MKKRGKEGGGRRRRGGHHSTTSPRLCAGSPPLTVQTGAMNAAQLFCYLRIFTHVLYGDEMERKCLPAAEHMSPAHRKWYCSQALVKCIEF